MRNAGKERFKGRFYNYHSSDTQSKGSETVLVGSLAKKNQIYQEFALGQLEKYLFIPQKFTVCVAISHSTQNRYTVEKS